MEWNDMQEQGQFWKESWQARGPLAAW